MATNVVFSRKSAPACRREERRHRVECVRVTVNGEAETPFAAVLEDISTFGCRLNGVDALLAGQRLWLRLPGSPPLVASVAWCHEHAAGCRFDTPIGQPLMRSLLPSSI